MNKKELIDIFHDSFAIKKIISELKYEGSVNQFLYDYSLDDLINLILCEIEFYVEEIREEAYNEGAEEGKEEMLQEIKSKLNNM